MNPVIAVLPVLAATGVEPTVPIVIVVLLLIGGGLLFWRSRRAPRDPR